MISDREIFRSTCILWHYSSPCWLHQCRECLPLMPCAFHIMAEDEDFLVATGITA